LCGREEGPGARGGGAVGVTMVCGEGAASRGWGGGGVVEGYIVSVVVVGPVPLIMLLAGAAVAEEAGLHKRDGRSRRGVRMDDLAARS